MNAIILSIGDELVLGQTVDTNSAWISRQLASVGCAVAAHLTVGDDQRAIEQAMIESVGRCDFLIISGGIGPTEDDLTRQALATIMNVPLEQNDAWLARLETYFQRLGRVMPRSNTIQAMIPRGATIIENELGTAAGIDVAYRSGDQKTICRIFVMPGVPKEMKGMFTRAVLPHVQQAGGEGGGGGGGAVILSRTLHTFGVGESTVAEKLGTLMMRQKNPSVGTTVSDGIVSLRVNARFGSREQAANELEKTVAACRAALGDLIFGVDKQTLQGQVGNMLRERGLGVAVAESCTGGWLSKMLTDEPGSSRYFSFGWVTYGNDAKQALLGVSPALLNQHGAVSEPVVIDMARSALRQAAADYALAISGIAGPEGGTPDKPVGTVCIALARDEGTMARTFVFPGDREFIRDRSAKMALTMLRYELLGRKMPF
ncbi:MAG TPA: competence/damage-inducible protein A [Tepidisphaeraceae bacterium]|nr:competence/damage-inducible protein A [Tepidisphaeraceae bacterium]